MLKNKISTNLLFLACMFCLFTSKAQDSTHSATAQNIYNHYIEFESEYYQIFDNTSILEYYIFYQPRVDNKNYIFVDFGLTHCFIESERFFKPADISIAYQRNIYSKKNKTSGFQSLGLRAKFIIPTGSFFYFSGFDSWTFEPLIQSRWIINSKLFFQLQARFSYSFAALPGSSPRFSYLRVEPKIVYSSNYFLIYVTPDYRYIHSRQSHTLFPTGYAGYKLSPISGIGIEMAPRVLGDQFYQGSLILRYYTSF